jgi:thiol-disulfide isomerase/thioredoxin
MLTLLTAGVQAVEVDLTGQVVDDQGSGIAGATVRIASLDLSETTDADGAFALQATPIRSRDGLGGTVSDATVSRDILRLSIPTQGARVKVSAYTLQGGHVLTACNGKLAGGAHAIRLLPRDAANQAYIIELNIDGRTTRFTHTPMGTSAVMTKAATDARQSSLDKSAEVVDTLFVSAEGYTSKKVALQSYTGELTVTLAQDNAIGDPPQTFTKKVLIEDITATWCGYCPDAMPRIWAIEDAHPGQIVAIAMHESDDLEADGSAGLSSYFALAGYPSGRVDRIANNGEVCLNRGIWSSVAATRANRNATCGLALDASAQGKVDVYTAFTGDLSGDIRLSVYLVEDSVTGTNLAQANYYNTDASSPFYQRGNPMTDYVHENVLRKMLTTDEFGDATSATAGTAHKTSFTFNTTGYRQAQCYIVAFVERKGATNQQHEVLNVQMVKVGQIQTWD